MYFPFLRAKQFELTLLRDNVELIKENNFHPIIEPVRSEFKVLCNTVEILNEKKIEYTLIVNPQTGSKPVKQDDIIKNILDEYLMSSNNMTIGFILKPDSKINDLSTLLKKYRNSKFTIIHAGYENGKKIAELIKPFNNIENHIFIDSANSSKLYRRHFANNGIKRALIRDGFKSKQKNSLYPKSEHFSDLHVTFPDEGMDGFGDYLIVGDKFNETGGPAHAVVIHITYMNDEGDMMIFHFKSDRTDSPTDPGGKFLEALKKFINEYQSLKSKIYKSNACEVYVKLFDKQHYPGLGYVKKLSMQHHVELMAYILNER